ncbi:hypothetical protein c7_R662 [Megavirus courdo7]|uniref:Uncharacterized protein n=1 Tax=Megavirus courdo7 TaxID=1128135 RepID=H2EBF2_9VIRU|nr:hypothetical protein c7_R662 [Megavirus courdo7]
MCQNIISITRFNNNDCINESINILIINIIFVAQKSNDWKSYNTKNCAIFNIINYFFL